MPIRKEELFNKLLTTCLKEFPYTRTRPLPVIISDGKIVDLYEFSNVVRKQGGFDLVFANKCGGQLQGIQDSAQNVSIRLPMFHFQAC